MIMKKRLTRIIAFIISCVLVGICVFQCVFIINENMKQVEDRNNRADVMESYEYTRDMNELFDKLWAISSIYLRNVDDKSKYTCSKEYEKSIKQAMQELGLMDRNGHLVIDNPRGFKYYASCGESICMNSVPEALKGEYSIEYENGGVSKIPKGVNWHYNPDMHWYTTNYGLTYYIMYGSLPKQAVALYDFDTTGLDSYIDENGAKIYYRTDGSTPLPEKTNIDNFSYESANREALEQFDYDRENVHYVLPDERNGFDGSGITDEDKSIENVWDMSEVTDTDVYMFFDEQSREWLKVRKDKFQKYKENNNDITIYIKPSDQLIAEYESYHSQRETAEQDSVHRAMPFLPVGIAGIIIGIVLLFVCGYDAEKKKFVLSMPDRIFAELPVIFIGGTVAGVITLAYGIDDIRRSLAEYYTDVDMGGIITGSAVTACYAIGLGSLITLSTRIKCKSLFKTSLICKILAFIWKYLKKSASFIRRILNHRSMKHIEKISLKKDIFMRRFIIRTAIAVGAEFVMAVFSLPYPYHNIEGFMFGSVIVLLVYVYFSFRDHAEIAGVAKQIADMNGGDYSPRVVSEKSPAYGMTNNLNNISDGIKSAVDKQVQSERMKVELVTNVSHDLKTPLTSIISYIDLLSAEEMSPAARDYVTIISQKSDRLKAMVSDLFDLAKATSHTDVSNEEIDAVILTQQVIGDMADKIAQSGMEVRTDIKVQAAPIMAEGRKLYRVLQNLIDNALKYSMEGTRIYVTLDNDDTSTHISVKNISAEEMDFTPEEITERFTRGDRSRTTEGNGLGLSIAKSFTEACGGQFEVVIDGDMFTANVILPLDTKQN
ncbi:sensor histidine kinase [Ruminococcus flavefaciens]|uniref:histidine kinase n=1 Tax=Ruminococcus flavefaciens TaxID=1265 RepID=A0A1K1NF26_RUMFL|nr:HAMP domain-containing sensor histidine kinase [Ruminococcus flavefaciens]SFW33916.1 Signal transduction histidine kinase [Ruminococcus flavefaciens]